MLEAGSKLVSKKDRKSMIEAASKSARERQKVSNRGS